jgi:hypothetical protein
MLPVAPAAGSYLPDEADQDHTQSIMMRRIASLISFAESGRGTGEFEGRRAQALGHRPRARSTSKNCNAFCQRTR